MNKCIIHVYGTCINIYMYKYAHIPAINRYCLTQTFAVKFVNIQYSWTTVETNYFEEKHTFYVIASSFLN